jgi:hypothetical protein
MASADRIRVSPSRIASRGFVPGLTKAVANCARSARIGGTSFPLVMRIANAGAERVGQHLAHAVQQLGRCDHLGTQSSSACERQHAPGDGCAARGSFDRGPGEAARSCQVLRPALDQGGHARHALEDVCARRRRQGGRAPAPTAPAQAVPRGRAVRCRRATRL